MQTTLPLPYQTQDKQHELLQTPYHNFIKNFPNSIIDIDIMPPVRRHQNTRSRRERDANFSSPTRARGRQRRDGIHGTNQPSPRACRTTSNATATVAEPTHVPTPIMNSDEKTDRLSGESQINILPPVDTIFPYSTSNTEFQGPPFDITQYQPIQTPSSFDPISAHVPQKIKQNIWAGRYIDL